MSKNKGEGSYQTKQPTHLQVIEINDWLKENERLYRSKTRQEVALLCGAFVGYKVSESTISRLGNILYPKPVKQPKQLELCGCSTCPMESRVMRLEVIIGLFEKNRQ